MAFSSTPTVKPSTNFNAENDANSLRKAMKGLGTDEKAIIDVLAHRSNAQRIQIKNTYKTMFGKDLIKDLVSELSGRFEDVIVALLRTPDEYDAFSLRQAIAGAGTDEDCLIEILCARSNEEIRKINATYKTMYGRNLEKDLIGDTSGHFKRLMVSLVTANRIETETVDVAKAKVDAQKLYAAGIKKLGTDESTFNSILALQSYPQLRAVFVEYENLTGSTLEKSIKSEMSSNLELGMLAIVNVVKDRPGYYAEKLYRSMKGAGTDDNILIRIVVNRCEVDMVEIKQAFRAKYNKELSECIKNDTSGDYRRVLVALVG